MKWLALVAVCACSTPKALVDAGPESFASQYARAICDSIEGCCAKNRLKLDRASCIAVVEGEEQARMNEETALGNQVNAEAAARCLGELRATFAACPIDDWEVAQKRVLRACDVWTPPAEPGTKSPGESCKTSDECSPIGCDEASCEEWAMDRATGERHCTCHHQPAAGMPCEFYGGVFAGPNVWDCPENGYVMGSFYVFRRLQYPQDLSAWSSYC